MSDNTPVVLVRSGSGHAGCCAVSLTKLFLDDPFEATHLQCQGSNLEEIANTEAETHAASRTWESRNGAANARYYISHGRETYFALGALSVPRVSMILAYRSPMGAVPLNC